MFGLIQRREGFWGNQVLVRNGKSSVLGMLTLRCLLDIQVKMSIGSWIYCTGVQGNILDEDRNLVVIGTWMAFTVMRLDEITR